MHIYKNNISLQSTDLINKKQYKNKNTADKKNEATTSTFKKQKANNQE